METALETIQKGPKYWLGWFTKLTLKGIAILIAVFLLFLFVMLFVRGWQIYQGSGVTPYGQHFIDQAGMMIGVFPPVEE